MKRWEIIFLVGVAFGATGIFVVDQTRQPVWNYAIWFSYNGEKAIAVKPDGKIEFGPAYTADTLRQLLDGLKTLRNPGQAVCRDADYRFPLCDPAEKGVIRIYPGTANPPPPRLQRDL